jgi:hypothetical protein
VIVNGKQTFDEDQKAPVVVTSDGKSLHLGVNIAATCGGGSLHAVLEVLQTRGEVIIDAL